MSQVRRRFSMWALALCTTALAGCGGDSTGPGAGNLSDPAALSADMQSLQTPFEAPVLQSFDLVALSSAGTPTGRLVAFMAAMSPRGKMPVAGALQQRQSPAFRALRPALAARPSFAVLPVEALGAVYEWDLGTQQYVEGSAVGPANGVRFVLYAVNPLTGLPADPLAPVGYADFLDESSGATNALRVLVVGDDAVTYANYVVTGTAGTTATAAASGFLTNGTRRLDFSAELTASATEISLDYALDLDQPDVSAALAITLTAPSANTAVIETTFSITRGSETVVLDGTFTFTSSGETFSATANFTVNVNGGLFATISGSSSSGTAVSYTMTGPGGRALTQEERDAVEALFDAPSQMDALITLLFEPLQEIFGSYSPSD